MLGYAIAVWGSTRSTHGACGRYTADNCSATKFTEELLRPERRIMARTVCRLEDDERIGCLDTCPGDVPADFKLTEITENSTILHEAPCHVRMISKSLLSYLDNMLQERLSLKKPICIPEYISSSKRMHCLSSGRESRGSRKLLSAGQAGR